MTVKAYNSVHYRHCVLYLSALLLVHVLWLCDLHLQLKATYSYLLKQFVDFGDIF